MARFDLSDFEWSVIQPLLPNKVRGIARVDDRRVINGILWRWRAGAPWADIPERYGSHKTYYNRFVRRRRAGVWDRILDAVSEAYDGDIQMIDSSSIRVHQHGANGDKKRGSDCMGRSRGGLTSKIHAVVDACGLPIGLSLSEGQAYDGHQTVPLLSNLPENAIVLADRAYDADTIRELIKGLDAFPNIPPMPQRRRRPAFSRYLYKMRNLVERFFNKLKHFRAVAARYEKDPSNYMAGVKLASARIWIRLDESTT
ncbi:IS5 family transposase [Roseibium aggregatum]|uniref:IS5 family transposase n=1 Tax=Roseibium aggregatum TaxID=187304 RepID=UPI001E2B02DA|nr:IS5 family transposase [Roseibium aggregatum]